MNEKTQPELSPNKLALLKIRELKERLAEAEQTRHEDIAIVSMACRFPKSSNTPEKFWESLMTGADESSEVPAGRWDLEAFYDEDPEVPGKMYARRGAFLDEIDQMDPEFFGISPREAAWVDPQQRLLMEVGWEALERAGWKPEKIGARTGIFVGWMHNDYQNEASDSFLNLNPYIATGAAGSFLCGRLAYYLGLEGPSLAVDTACSSSLVALHLGCLSLYQRDCDQALVGGVNAIVSPTTNILTCKLSALSPQGHSRAFDAAADGYLRGEGCGVVTLKRLAEAQRDGDPVIGVIKGSAVGHNGFSGGLTVPNPKAQERVIRSALKQANITADEVGYLEAHGTGTELGDPIEVRAAAAALAESRSNEDPLLFGSVKTNIGHLEAAAGMAGLIKVLLSFEKGVIPGQLNFDTPNPHIPWDQLPMKVVTEQTPWPQKGESRVAGVSAFGMSGTNAHVVLAAPASGEPDPSDEWQQPVVVPMSGRSENAVRTLARDLLDWCSTNRDVAIEDVAKTMCERKHFEHRASCVADGVPDLVRQLGQLVDGRGEISFRRTSPRVAWQFTGQGCQYPGMATQLYQNEPVFREAIDFCDDQLRLRRERSLIEVIQSGGDLIHQTQWTQPAIFAVQMGLVKLLQSWGIQPDYVMGHSVGQYAAACTAGAMTWETGVQLIAERGRVIGELPAGGEMVAVFARPDAVEKEIDGVPAVSLAANNGTHSVISGPSQEVQQIASRLTDQNVKCVTLQTSHAFHSQLMDPVLGPFQNFASQFEFFPPQIPLVCNVTGQVVGADRILGADYWSDHIRQAVRYQEGVETLNQSSVDLLVELGPRGVLTRMAASHWAGAADSRLGSLDEEVDDTLALRQLVSALYRHGLNPVWDEVGPAGQHLLLPTYPFQRRRFWGPPKPKAFHAAIHTAHPLLGGKVSLAGLKNEVRFEAFVEPDSPAWLPDHQVMGETVYPGAAFVEMLVAASKSSETHQRKSIGNIKFEQPLQIRERSSLQTVVRTESSNDGGPRIEIYSSPVERTDWARHCSATILDETSADPDPVPLQEIKERLGDPIGKEIFYSSLQELGLDYGHTFQGNEELRYSKDEVLTRLYSAADVRGCELSPPVLDAAFHSLAAGMVAGDETSLFLPLEIGQFDLWKSMPDTEIWCHAKWTQPEGALRVADLTLCDEKGNPFAQITDLRLKEIDPSVLRKMSGQGVERLIYKTDWKPIEVQDESGKGRTWLVVESERQVVPGEDWVAALEAFGESAVRVQLKSDTEFVADAGHYLVDGSQAQWEQLLNEIESKPSSGLGDGRGTLDGVLWKCAVETVDSELQVQALMGFSRAFLSEPSGSPNRRRLPSGLQLLTWLGCEPDSRVSDREQSHKVNPAASQFWGLGRVLGAEFPELQVRLLDIAEDVTEQAVRYVCNENSENQVSVGRSSEGAQVVEYRAPRLKNVPGRSDASFPIRDDASYLITGGLGMLGRRAAEWLIDRGANHVVLVSRRAPDELTREFLASLTSAGAVVEVVSADISDETSVQQLVARFGTEFPVLAGLIHAAGVLDDGLFQDQDWDRFTKVLSPKIHGATFLDRATRGLELDFFVLYSSVASILGSRGQSNYAMGNAYMDGLAWARRNEGWPATSINWGPWTEGMADNELVKKQLALQGIVPLDADEAHRAMERILALDLTQATVLDVNWKKLSRSLGGTLPLLSEVAPAASNRTGGTSEFVKKLQGLKGNARLELMVQTVQGELQTILSTPELPETDRPLIEMGLDSLMAVEFGTRLQMLLGDGVSVAPTMLFDHPTIDAISSHVLELIESESGVEAETQVVAPEALGADNHFVEREPIAIVGMSCRFPGARNRFEFWQNLLDGVDSVGEIPGNRWDIDRFYSETPTPGKMYTREGGFLDDMGEFDAAFFNVSEQEACWIDPQHRMLLENSWHALEDAGIAPQSGGEKNVGVFMGIMGSDYAFLPSLEDSEIIEAFQGAGLAHSAGVGRLSFVFGFEGPSVAIDTASSSSLVAVCQAMRSLQDRQCHLALAGGVNAILAPVNSLLMSKAGFLSPDGRCKSFSAQADGFGRGEGCGVVVLKRLSDAERDGDRIFAVLEGGAISHNGTSGGLTTPSGKSQGRVIQAALEDAGVAPSEVQYLEAHGTGTEYGDPMEISAAASVFGRGRDPEVPLLVGSVKANISHLEAAGGISGLMKTALAIHHGVLPRQLHFEEPSPHVPWNRLPVQMVTEQMEWPEVERRVASVTALGLSGTNAHVVLSSPSSCVESAKSDSVELNPQELSRSAGGQQGQGEQSELLLLSAKTASALEELTESYIGHLDSLSGVSVRDVCYSAATGRKKFGHRLAVVGSNAEELRAGLDFHGVHHKNGSHLNSGVGDLMRMGPGQSTTHPKIGWFFGSLRKQRLRDWGRWFEDYGRQEWMDELQSHLDELLPTYGSLEQKLASDEILTEDSILASAVELAWWDAVQAMGVEPDLVTGTGVGALLATAVAGGMDIGTAFRLTIKRYQLFGDQVPNLERDAAKLNEFESFADEFDYVPPNRTCVCNLTGTIIPVYQTLAGSHWREQVYQPEDQTAVWETVEASELQRMIVPGQLKAVAGSDRLAKTPSVANHSVRDWFLLTLGELFVQGVEVDWKQLFAGRIARKVTLPNYPYSKQRYWITEISKHVVPEVS